MQQEEAGQPVVGDQCELLVETRGGCRVLGALAIALVQGVVADARQLAVGIIGGGVAIAEIAGQIELAAQRQAGRLGDGARHVPVERGHLLRSLQHVLAVAPSLGLACLERAAAADGYERILKRCATAAVDVHVVRDHRDQIERAGELAQGAQPRAVTTQERSCQLHAQPLGPERVAQGAASPQSGLPIVVDERPVTRTAGERDQALRPLCERCEGQLRDEPIGPVRLGDRPAEVAIALCRLAQHGHVESPGAVAHGQLGARDRLDTAVARRLCEGERAAQVVVVGQRERLEAELRRLAGRAPRAARRRPGTRTSSGSAARRTGGRRWASAPALSRAGGTSPRSAGPRRPP